MEKSPRKGKRGMEGEGGTSISCCLGGSPGRGIVGAAEMVARALSEPQQVEGGDLLVGDDSGPRRESWESKVGNRIS